MTHWTDPTKRGVYDHPAAPPPSPRPHHTNDHGHRLARMEEHISFAAWDRQRIEAESRLRAADLALAVRAVSDRVSVQERHTSNRRHTSRFLMTWSGRIASLLKYAVAAILAVLLMAGKISVEVFKPLLGILGFPVG